MPSTPTAARSASPTPAAKAFGRQAGKLVGEKRRSLGWSGADLAARTGVSLDAIRSIETGRIASPGLFAMARICRAMDYSLDDLVRMAQSTHADDDAVSDAARRNQEPPPGSDPGHGPGRKGASR